jgi:hypothetical protein
MQSKLNGQALWRHVGCEARLVACWTLRCAAHAAPTVTSIEPEQLPTQGGTVLIRGFNMGSNPSLVSVGLVHHELQFEVLDMVEAHTVVRCRVPPMPASVASGTPVEVALSVDGAYCKSSPRVTFSALVVPSTYVFVCNRALLGLLLRPPRPAASSVFAPPPPHTHIQNPSAPSVAFDGAGT